MQAPTKRKLVFAAKLAFSLGMLVVIYSKVVGRDGAEDLFARLADLSWGWVAAAVLMQLTAIGFSTVRWQRLLVGQGIHAPWRFLIGSIMIARFWGAFTPGGFTGFGGWRIYDVAKHTGKTARATATIGVEMILGQLAFGVVVMAGSIFGLRFIGMEGVILVNAFFVALIAVGLLLLAKPHLFRLLAKFLPGGVRARVQTLVDAVCAYQGKTGLLSQAALLGVGTHAFNNLIYVCAARALGVELGIGEVFFGSSLQIFATLIPASINGVGLREAAAVALYTQLGMPVAVAVLIPTVGFAAEMLVSSFGGLVFVSRRTGYAPQIRVDDADREKAVYEAMPEVPQERWPLVGRGLTIGLGAGLLAGLLVGVGEGVVVVLSGSSAPDWGVLWYGAIAYGLLLAIGGAIGGAALAYGGRLMKREAMAEPDAYARLTAAMVAVVALGLGAFRVRRDVFHEELVWKSASGLLVLFGCAIAAAILYLVLATLLRLVTARRPGRIMLRAWGSPAVVGCVIGAIAASSLVVGQPAEAAPGRNRPAAPGQANNVLFIVVDTLRADHLPGYGYDRGRTPSLDAFARDAIRFDQAFANASWTRPSFASILTGRYPSSHSVMAKSDSLSSELVTMPEAFAAAGYQTAGFVTNYNVAPFYNFHQGFDEYRYLEPEFVLGANDTAAKLLLVQFVRQQIEKMRAAEPGAAYRDAETVNGEVFSWLERAPDAPFFLFVAYMDPHDPYFEHPYDGPGYSRAGNQSPRPEEAPRLRQLYDGEITYWDEHFGRLVEDLKRRGMYDEMTIVVTSDHGEEFMDHGGYWHGTTLYDEQVRVPLFVKLPHNQRGGSVVRHWVQSIDLMPTLLRLNGAEAVDGVQGGDLFEGTDEVYAEESHEGNVLESLRTRRGLSELKVITANAGNPRGLPELEMFRVDQDPGEHVDLSEELPGELEIARGRLEYRGEQASHGAVERQEVDGSGDPNNAARLRALGYAGGE